jgi:LacI family sucrose operon transcriptional repressor
MDINGIARLAGVSRATVSRYLNDGYVSEEKRRLIKQVIDETGYVPSQQAKTLRTGKTNLVGVVIPKINSQSVSRMVAGLTSVLNESKYQMLLANTDNDTGLEVEYLKLFAERNRVDGIVLIATVITPAHRKVLGETRVPVVVLGQELSGCTSVFNDDYHALLDVTNIVLEHSTHPAFIGVLEDDVSAGQMRHRGFLDACRDHGIEVPERAQCVSDFTVDAGYLAAERLLGAYPEADAMVCASDNIAFGAMTCLREYGRRIPQDVQVTGVGDTDLARVITPTLTTVHHHYKTAGMEAAKVLVGAMGERDDVDREVRMSYGVLRRNSTL